MPSHEEAGPASCDPSAGVPPVSSLGWAAGPSKEEPLLRPPRSHGAFPKFKMWDCPVSPVLCGCRASPGCRTLRPSSALDGSVLQNGHAMLPPQYQHHTPPKRRHRVVEQRLSRSYRKHLRRVPSRWPLWRPPVPCWCILAQCATHDCTMEALSLVRVPVLETERNLCQRQQPLEPEAPRAQVLLADPAEGFS